MNTKNIFGGKVIEDYWEQKKNILNEIYTIEDFPELKLQIDKMIKDAKKQSFFIRNAIIIIWCGIFTVIGIIIGINS